MGEHPLFSTVVRDSWVVSIQGCKMIQVVQKRKHLMVKLKLLNKSYIKNIVVEEEGDRKTSGRLKCICRIICSVQVCNKLKKKL